jgi:transcriptional regulator with XRE-family HTH domain
MQTARPYLSKLERGVITPTLDTLERTASALGIDMSELFLRLANQFTSAVQVKRSPSRSC